MRSLYEYMAFGGNQVSEHCIVVNHLYCIWCDQFVPITLFLVAYIDTKLVKLCYIGVGEETLPT